MNLKTFIPEPYKPAFTHRPKFWLWLCSSYSLRVYPTAIELYTCDDDRFSFVERRVFSGMGPVASWTAFVDSLRQYVVLQGHSDNGFFRHRIDWGGDGIALRTRNERVVLGDKPCEPPRFPSPRLQLGMHTSPCWERVLSRSSLAEILPFWYQLTVPKAAAVHLDDSLFTRFSQAVENRDCRAVCPALQKVLVVGMEDYFLPKRVDDQYLGEDGPIFPSQISLKDVHAATAASLRACFIRESEGIELLPCLPPEFVSGRLLREQTARGHTINLEWRKGALRQVLLQACSDDIVRLSAPVSSCYVRTDQSRKRKITLSDGLFVESGKRYLLDNFSI